jgi:glycosyltransferase involved in cell wall biosynthesis
MSQIGDADSPKLSIIIPCYNEEKRLPATLEALAQFVADPANKALTLEAIVVDNASRDATFAIANEFAASHPYVRIMQEATRGKGAAVRSGVYAARGEYIFMCDADLSMPMGEMPKFFAPTLGDYDVAIGSSEGKGAKRFNEPFMRHLQGRVGSLLTKIILGLNYEDTQCGYKCFKRDAAHTIFKRQTLNGWGFDFELLQICKTHNLNVKVVPIHWYYRADGNIQFGLSAMKTLSELWKVRQNSRAGVYR